MQKKDLLLMILIMLISAALAGCGVDGVLSTGSSSGNGAEQMSADAEEEEEEEEDGPQEGGPFAHWYRDIRFGSWVNLGANADTIIA